MKACRERLESTRSDCVYHHYQVCRDHDPPVSGASCDNQKLEFEGMQVQIACTEIALILKVFGNGAEVPVDYVKAFFQEGRIPRIEGWLKRRWWTLGLIELNILASKIKGILGPSEKGAIPIVNVVH